MVVDLGGRFLDVFVYHRAYGLIRTKLNIRSRLDVAVYIEEISTGKSRELLNITSGYHYHTIEADSEEILDLIQEKLREKGFLAKLSAYEPVDFQKQAAARAAVSGMKTDAAGSVRS
jgi:transcriptional regulator of NAD metabolism